MLMLAKELARRGLRVAVIAFSSPQLPAEVDGVRIIGRSPYKKPDSIPEKLLEVLRIGRSLWRAPSRTIVYRGVGFELGLLAAYARLAGRRLVYSSASATDFNVERLYTNRLAASMFELGMRLADVIVVQTADQVELCERRVKRTPALIHSIAEPAERSDVVPEAFLWVGRIHEYKRPLDYVALARAVPEARFWMIAVPRSRRFADQTLGKRLLAEAESVPNLELLPARSREGVAQLLSRAVASVNTSEFEGMPNVLLEAWSRGVPALVLGHDPGGVVTAYGLGAFAHGSFDNFVALARQQWSTRDRRHEVSERCRAYIEQHHAPDVVVSRWHQVLSGALFESDPKRAVMRESTCVG